MKEKHLTILSAIILVFVSFNAVSADDLKAQNAAGWWQGERYGVMTINSKSFTFNAIKLITWLEQ